jgi:hypothetical protein
MHADGRPTGMAFIEFETPQEAVRAMEKDRAKFGPEYGERFCMLQLVGRHEMDKVQLQRESDAVAPNKLLVSGAWACGRDQGCVRLCLGLCLCVVYDGSLLPRSLLQLCRAA